jgi:hypothetical protein
MTQRYINLPALGRSVPLSAYVKAVKLAKANPKAEFKTGLTCWWPCTGSEVLAQFMRGVEDRINQGIPYSQRGMQ